MKVTYYRNKRNYNKFLEVHNDGHYHNTVRQFIYNYINGHRNITGDGSLHRWRAGNLRELLEDYDRVIINGDLICRDT